MQNSNIDSLFEYFNIDLKIENCTDELEQFIHDELFKFSPYAFKRHCNFNTVEGIESILKNAIRENKLVRYEIVNKNVRIFYFEEKDYSFL